MASQISLLKQLDLSEKEAKLYLTALEFGPTTVAKLARKSGIKRTTIYEFIDDLITRGLIITSVSGKRRLYSAIPPENLEKLAERRLGQETEKQKEVIEKLLPELSFLVSKSPQKPKIRFYEGIEGLKAVYEDTLKQPKGSEIVGFAVFEETYRVLPAIYLRGYVKRRVKKNISIRIILPSDKYIEEHARVNKEELRESILLPRKDFPISNEINIYQNKVAILSFGDEKIGIIIESQQIADTQRAIFNLLWKSLKELDKLKK